MTKPLAIDLYCGLGGWTEGFLAEGYDVIGFDIERHVYDDARYPAQLVLQDVLTLHGAQLRDAAVIVASSPCQAYSYMAMPWSRAKARREYYRDPAHPERLLELNALFDAPARIQREASAAAGRVIPMVQENVKGAQPWVGRARWHFGSYYLWGDVPALMPIPAGAVKVPGQDWNGYAESGVVSPHWRMEGVKAGDRNRKRADGGHEWTGNWDEARKNAGGSWFAQGHPQGEHSKNPVHEAVKQSGLSGTRDNGKGDRWFQDGAASFGSKSSARRAASAHIAKIPLALARHIAHVYHP